jgi:hypothetical protein
MSRMRVLIGRLKCAAACAAFVSITNAAQAAAFFTAGDLVVSVEGNGSGTASGGTAATGNSSANAGTYLHVRK